AALQRRLASEIGATREVLIESATSGRTEHFLAVAISGEVPGRVRALEMTGHDGSRLTVRGRLFPSPLVGEGGADAVRAG
ncbi:MAG: tRNA (N(6)-L-threonylcarbamoyladenosine(37)-C(2))-methylthiotransferase MtaB, partial [Bradyrhizobium sp.]